MAIASYKASLSADSGAPFLVNTPSTVPAAFGDIGRDRRASSLVAGLYFGRAQLEKICSNSALRRYLAAGIDPRFDHLSAVRRLNEFADVRGSIAPL